jgi:predicted dehydrogenase
VELATICGRNPVEVEKARVTFGWQSAATDWRAVIADPAIDIIDITTPNDTHAEIAIVAAKAGKAVLCEKPLARTLAEAERMVAAVKKARVVNMVCHNYRRIPAIALAKRLIEGGELGGRIYHFRVPAHVAFAEEYRRLGRARGHRRAHHRSGAVSRGRAGGGVRADGDVCEAASTGGTGRDAAPGRRFG